MLNKPAKSITPLKSVHGSHSGRPDLSASAREKALMKQNVELKKENADLIRLLKKSKELIRDELGKSQAENQTLKRFVESVWTAAEGKVDDKLREEVKSLLGPRELGKMNTTTTNHTDNLAAEPIEGGPQPRERVGRAEHEELERLRHREAQCRSLMLELSDARHEKESLVGYLLYTQHRSGGVERKGRGEKEALPVDSANVGSEADEEEMNGGEWGQEGRKVATPCVLPSFFRGLMLK